MRSPQAQQRPHWRGRTGWGRVHRRAARKVARAKQRDRRSARHLVDVGDQHDIIVPAAGALEAVDELVALVVLAHPEPRGAVRLHPHVEDLVRKRGEAAEVVRQHRRAALVVVCDVGFGDHKDVDDGVELVQPRLDEIDLIGHEEEVEDAHGRRASLPPAARTRAQVRSEIGCNIEAVCGRDA